LILNACSADAPTVVIRTVPSPSLMDILAPLPPTRHPARVMLSSPPLFVRAMRHEGVGKSSSLAACLFPSWLRAPHGPRLRVFVEQSYFPDRAQPFRVPRISSTGCREGRPLILPPLNEKPPRRPFRACELNARFSATGARGPEEPCDPGLYLRDASTRSWTANPSCACTDSAATWRAGLTPFLPFVVRPNKRPD